MTASQGFLRSIRAPIAVIAGASVLGLVGAEVYSASSPAPASASRLHQALEVLLIIGKEVQLPVTPGTEKVVMQSTVPKGSYVVQGSGDLLNNSTSSDRVRCWIVMAPGSGAQQSLASIDTGLSLLSNGAAGGPPVAAVSNFSFTGAGTTKTSANVALECQQANGSNVDVGSNTKLWIHKAKSLQVVQQTVSGPTP
jgi:hypothetical protein